MIIIIIAIIKHKLYSMKFIQNEIILFIYAML